MTVRFFPLVDRLYICRVFFKQVFGGLRVHLRLFLSLVLVFLWMFIDVLIVSACQCAGFANCVVIS